jgi:hypothetical protein
MILTSRRLFTAILFIALFVMATREIADPDFWWHLRTGQFIVETHSIPRVDVFSFTNAGQPWITHEWLSEVLIFAIYWLGSFPALILTFSGIIALAFAFVYARSPGRPYIAAPALLLAALSTSITWGVRPQVISLLFTSIFLYVTDRWRTSFSASVEVSREEPATNRRYALRNKLLWILPPLMVLWVNLHSGYALGLAIIAVYLFGEIVSQAGQKLQDSGFTLRAARNSPLVVLTLVFIACLIVVPLNPNGATMYVYPFETLTSRTMQAYIQEWFSPDFHQIEFQPFAWLLLATLATTALAGKRMSLTQSLLLAGSGYAALRSARNIPIFAIIAAPILAEQLWHLAESHGWNKWLTRSPRSTRVMIALNWFVLLLIVAAGAIRIGMVVSNQNAVERDKYPAAAVDFMRAQSIRGNLYDTYGWGGYLIWRLYPGTRVFIDGRADVYGDQFIEDQYLKAYRGGDDWRAPLDQYDVRTVLVEPNAPIATQIARDSTWKKMFEDKQAVIYSR